MSREEAIEYLNTLYMALAVFPNQQISLGNVDELKEAVTMAIKALSQEPTDVVSRDAVNTLVDELARAISDERCHIPQRGRDTGHIMHDILDLPSVTQKSGRWKVHRKYYECSSCGSQISNEFFVNYRFCPHCGARMESEEV